MLSVFLALLTVPLIEIALFILIGKEIGLLATVGLVILTALVGMALIRRQGMETLAAAEAEMARGQPPVRQMLDGVCLLVGALLLLTPGFLTDTVGFVLLIPAGRAVLGRWVWRGLERRHAWRVRPGGFPGEPGGPDGPAGPEGGPSQWRGSGGRRRGSVTIDSEYRDLDKT